MPEVKIKYINVRDIPLKDLSVALCRNLKSKTWRDVKTWRIKDNTYNELGSVWTELNEWKLER